MAENRLTLLTAREAAEYLRVSLFTLGKIEKQGGLVPFRTPGGHRRYSLTMLNEYLERSRQRSSPRNPPIKRPQRGDMPSNAVTNSLAPPSEWNTFEGDDELSPFNGIPLRGESPSERVHQVRILVVGGEPEAVESIVGALLKDSSNYEFASASDGYEAGVQVMAFKPDLIILDTAALGFDEFEFCRKVKSDPKTKHIKIIGVVAFGKDSDVERIIECGADDCLTKPLQTEELQRSVQSLIPLFDK